MTNAYNLTLSLGGRWHGRYGAAPCPVCQPERRKDQTALSVSEQGDTLLLYCFKSNCSFGEIAQAAKLPPKTVKIDGDNALEARRKREEYTAKQVKKARSVWDMSRPIKRTKAENYLRARGITCELPETLRFVPDIHHTPSATWVCAMVGLLNNEKAVHRTFFTKKGERLSKNAKLMLGPCAGGAVRLSEGQGPLVVCEGIETGLSLLSGLLDQPATVLAALSTSGIKSLILPEKPQKLIIATDGDEPGAQAGQCLASRAERLGWQVSMMPAPEGLDWNDVLLGERP